MPEIGMGAGAGVGSAGAGFGRGLAKALLMNRERADEQRKEENARKDRYLAMTLPILMQNTDWQNHPEDLEGFLKQHAPEFFDDQTQTTKTAKKTQGGKSGFDRIKEFLAPFAGLGGKGTVIESGWPGGPVTMKPGGGVSMGGTAPQATPSQQPAGVSGGTLGNTPVYGQPQEQPFTDRPPDISQALLGGGQTPQTPTAPPQHRLFGVPVLSTDEQAQRKADAEIAGLKRTIGARRDIAASIGRTPEQAIDYGLYGDRPPASAATAPAHLGTFEDFLLRKQSEGGKPLSSQDVAGARKEWESLNDSSKAAGGVEDFIQRREKELGHPLSSAEVLKAQSDWEAAKRPAGANAEGADALAQMAATNPAILQNMTPTKAGEVMEKMALSPQLRQRYEQVRMEPIRGQATNAMTALNDLVTTDKNGKVTGLTPGAQQIFGASKMLQMQKIPGTEAATAQSALDQLTGNLVVKLLSDMKAQSRTGATGFGQLSARELDVLESAATMLKGGISEKRALQELTTLRDRFGRIMQPSGSELNTTTPGKIDLNTPVYIGPDGKPRVGAQ